MRVFCLIPSVWVMVLTFYRVVNGEQNDLQCEEDSIMGIQMTRVTGGRNASSASEIPWQARIRYANEPQKLCGGTIIGQRWILSIAQCFYSRFGKLFEASDISVTVGSLHLDTVEETEQTINVSRILIHSSFSFSTTNFDYDFALLHLTDDIKPSDYAKPLCLPRSCKIVRELSSSALCLISGWGKADVRDRFYQNTLQISAVHVEQQRQCRRTMNNYARRNSLAVRVTSRMMCAGNLPGVDTCQGDGGGALACRTAGRNPKYFVAGLSSWGIGCATENLNGVYSKPCSVFDWINKERVQQIVDLPELPQCGVSAVSRAGSSSKTAITGEYPWNARIIIAISNGRVTKTCSGTLVSSQWVLTTTQCVFEAFNINYVTVELNVTNTRSNRGKVRMNVQQIVGHTSLELTMIKLANSLPLSDWIKPVCLPSNCSHLSNRDADCIVVGWRGIAGRSQQRLKVGRVSIKRNNNCLGDSGKLCTKETRRKGRCQADDGSGLFCRQSFSSPYTLYGAASQPQNSCSRPKSTTVAYSKVCTGISLNWIQRTMNNY